MEDALTQDLYTSNLFRKMKNDQKVNIVKGNAVNKDGDQGYCHFSNSEIDVAEFDKPNSWYTSVISKWEKKWTKYADNAKESIDNIRKAWQAMIYKHELTEDFYKGDIDHSKLIYKDMKETPEDSDVSLAQVVAADIGLEQGTKDAIELDGSTNIREIIQNYKDKWLEKYDIFKETVMDMLDIRAPQYAMAEVD